MKKSKIVVLLAVMLLCLSSLAGCGLFGGGASSFTVKFDLNGAPGTAPEAQTVNKGEYPADVTAPEWFGYKFNGWSTDKKDKTGEKASYFRINKNVTLYAAWSTMEVRDLITVIGANTIKDVKYIEFDNGGQKNKIYADEGEITKQLTISTEGASLGSGIWSDGEFCYKADTYYNEYIKQPLKYLGSSSLYKSLDEVVSRVSNNEFTDKGNGVYESADISFTEKNGHIDSATIYSNTYTFKYAGDSFPEFSLPAKDWTELFEVEVDLNGGKTADNESVIGFNDSSVAWYAFAQGKAKKANSVLEGLYKDSGLTQRVEFDSPITQNIKLYAKWAALTGGDKEIYETALSGSQSKISQAVYYLGHTSYTRYGVSKAKAEWWDDYLQSSYVLEDDGTEYWTVNYTLYRVLSDGAAIKYGYGLHREREFSHLINRLTYYFDTDTMTEDGNTIFVKGKSDPDSAVITIDKDENVITKIEMTVGSEREIYELAYANTGSHIPAMPSKTWTSAYRIEFRIGEDSYMGFKYHYVVDEHAFGFSEEYDIYTDNTYTNKVTLPLTLTESVELWLKIKE